MTLPLPVILAGGLGTRLGNLTHALPKPMIEVSGRPFLEHIVRQLVDQGFGEVLLLVGHQAEVIEEHFGNGECFGLSIQYSREPEPMGTGGAFRLARPFVHGRFLMLYGDLFRPVNYAALSQSFSGNALAVYPYVSGLTTIACPNVGLDLSGKQVSVYTKNRPELELSHVDAGFGFFEEEVLNLLPDGLSNFESVLYPALAASGRLSAMVVDRNFFDIGNPTDLSHARQWLGKHGGS